MKTTSNKGLNLIKKYEGLKLKPYLCPARVSTIGYGATYYEDGRKVALTDKSITKERAEQLLAFQLRNYENAVNRYVLKEINQNQFDALVSFCFNLGIGALQKSTLLKKINKNPKDKTIRTEFLKWSFAGGKQLKGLINRRTEESNLYFS